VIDDELERLRAEIEAHRELTTMIAGVTHDLNTPLGIINQAAGIIAERIAPVEAIAEDEETRDALEDVAEAAQLILNSASKARALVTSFRDLASRRIAERHETVSLDALVRETIDLFRYATTAGGLDIRYAGPEGQDRWDGYPGLLSRVLLNLLSNAERYAYPGAQGGRVDVSLAKSEGGYVITVTDHGAGMTAEQEARIFEPFYTTGRDRGGTGLGMAVVRDLVVNRLDGAIAIDSEPARGTTIEVRLPTTVKPPTEESNE
jgi:signal transduction histidine kinase